MVLERLLVLTRYASVVCVCVCDGGKEVVTHSVYMFGPIPLSALGWRNLGLGLVMVSVLMIVIGGLHA